MSGAADGPGPLTVRFDPGDGVAVVGPCSVCLVLDDPRSDLIARLRAALVGEVTTSSALEVMVQAAGLDLPPFGLVTIEGRQVRVVVRGRVGASIRSADGPVEVHGVRVNTWVEHVADDARSVRLAIDPLDLGSPATPVFETAAGSVPATTVDVVLSEATAGPHIDLDEVDSVRPPQFTGVPGPVVQGAVFDDDEADWVDRAELIVAGGVPEPPDVGVVQPTVVADEDEERAPDADDHPDASEVDDLGADPATADGDGGDLETYLPAADEIDPDSIVADEPFVEDLAELTRYEPEPNWVDGADAEEPGVIDADQPDPPSESVIVPDLPVPPTPLADPDPAPAVVDHGATLIGPFDHSDDGEVPEHESPGGAPLSFGVPEPAAATAAGPVQPDAAGPSDDYDHLFGATQFRTVEQAAVRSDEDPGEPISSSAPMISGVPGGAPSSAQPIPVAPDAGDHDGHTVSLASLRAQLKQSAPAPGASPSVHAVQCPSGHLNPTHAPSCRVCGAPIQEQEHVSVPRPVLGALKFVDGRSVSVSGPLLIGRSPKVEGVVTGEAPELIAVDSPLKEVSSTHLEIRLEGWQVLVVDRQSTNGTIVTAPGRDPQRLRPGEPVPITPGTRVSLADEAEFTFEASS